MDQTTQIEPASIDDLLAAYRDLQSQFERVRDRLRKAEDQKSTVPPRIYDRVRAEYDRELDSLRARMSPVRDELDRVHEGLEAQLRDAASIVQSVEEEISESEFRHRIGEFEQTAYADLRRTLDGRASQARSRLMLLQTTMSAITSLRRPATGEQTSSPPEVSAPAAEESPAAAEASTDAPEPAAVAAPAPEEPVHEEVAPPRPVLNAGKLSGARGADSFENPHDWISDVGGEHQRSERRVRPAPPVPPAPSDQLDSLLTPVDAPATGFPSLVFVSGVHAGQAIALLPTTLTIGREHDNNIEIKDPEVARYHARILRERDEYVVEDLNSSTGTWVNGVRTQRAVITHGDVIRVGQTELALDFEWTTDSR